MARRLKPYNAMVLLRCSDDKHDNCNVMRNTLVKNVSNVTMAYAATTDLDGEAYCVVARAIVNRSDVSALSKKIESLKDGRSNIRTDKVRLLLSVP